MNGFIRRGEYALAAGSIRSPQWIPLIAAEWRRGVLTHSVSEGVRRERPALPFGWAAEKAWDRAVWEIGPAWYILPRRWWRELRYRFYRLAIHYGAAEMPYDGCYYHELVWFPAQRWSA